MDVSLRYPARLEGDNDLSNPRVVEKYRAAADIANESLRLVVAHIAAGMSVHTLCKLGDDLMMAFAADVYNKHAIEKGIAFPTSICVNDQVQYNSPLPEDDVLLNQGDVVKIELAAHIDGYIAATSHTTVALSCPPTAPIQGPGADAIAAGHLALEAALRLLRPGQSISSISRIISETSGYFNCRPIEGTGGSTMRRFVSRAPGGDISNQISTEKENDDIIEFGKVYYLNVIVTTGSGTSKPDSQKVNILVRDPMVIYQLRLKSARGALSHIQSTHSIFPFPIYSLPPPAKLGLTELINHGLVRQLTPLKASNSNDVVAQYGATVIMTPTGPLRISTQQTLPWIHSDYRVEEGSAVANLLKEALPIRSVKMPKMADLISSGRVVLGRSGEEDEVMV